MSRIKWNTGISGNLLLESKAIHDSNHGSMWLKSQVTNDSNHKVLKFQVFPSHLFDSNHTFYDFNHDLSHDSNHGLNHTNEFLIRFRSWFKKKIHLTQITLLLMTRIKHHFSLVFMHNPNHLYKSFSSLTHQNIKYYCDDNHNFEIPFLKT